MPFKTLSSNSWFLLLFLIFSYHAQAKESQLTSRLNALVNEMYSLETKIKPDITVQILGPKQVIDKICNEPDLSLTGALSRPIGNRTLLAKCGSKRIYFRINIKALGDYWVAKETIQPGQKLSLSRLELKRGEMDGLPADLVYDVKQISGNVATRIIKAGQVIISSQLRKSWMVVSGEDVNVTATGNGFHIITSGKALDNAGLYENIRFRTRSGQLLTGTVTGRSSVKIKITD